MLQGTSAAPPIVLLLPRDPAPGPDTGSPRRSAAGPVGGLVCKPTVLTWPEHDTHPDDLPELGSRANTSLNNQTEISDNSMGPRLGEHLLMSNSPKRQPATGKSVTEIWRKGLGKVWG